MGKGTILGGGKDGLYLLNVDYGDVRRQQIIAEIDKRLATLATSIGSATAALAAEDAKVSAAQSAVDSALNALEQALQANPNGDHAALYADVKAKTDAYKAAIVAKTPFQVALSNLNAEKGSLESRRNQVASLKLISSFPAWCADFTENASGQVATIEVPGEPRTVLIAPGAPAPTSANGTVQARELMTPEQVFVNAALLPGWQKFKPTFRAGVITRISGNTCSVNLIDAESSANNLKINQTTSLSNVPIQYMDCNGAAFAKGDEVLIRFDGQDWKQPKVVGFLKEPKQCVGVIFNGGVYRDWGYYDTYDVTPPVTFKDTYFILRTPISLHKDLYSAANNEIVCTFENSYWGSHTLSVYDQYAYDPYFEKELRTIDQYGNFYHTQYKTVYFGNGDPTEVYEEIRIRLRYIWKDESALSYSYYLLSPCNEPYLEVSIEEYPIWGSLIAGHPFSYWEARHSGAESWTMFLSIKGKVIFSGTLTTTPQALYPYYQPFGDRYPPGVPGKGPLDDAYVCTYTGDRRPSIPWTWSGSGILIPPEVTWIQAI